MRTTVYPADPTVWRDRVACAALVEDWARFLVSGGPLAELAHERLSLYFLQADAQAYDAARQAAGGGDAAAD